MIYTKKLSQTRRAVDGNAATTKDVHVATIQDPRNKLIVPSDDNALRTGKVKCDIPHEERIGRVLISLS